MEKQKKSYYNCSVDGCLNSTLNSELSFFKLPFVPERRAEWLRLIHREDLIDSSCLRDRVCEAHFSPYSIKINSSRKLLKKNSIPQLLLPFQNNIANKGIQAIIETADANVQCDNPSVTAEHRFPKARVLSLAWAEAIGMEEWEIHNGSSICSMHFDRDHIVQTKNELLKVKEGTVPNSQDFQEDLNSPVDSKICRVCLTMNGLMYPMKEKKLDELYVQVTGISVIDGDRLPHQVCWECAARLINSAGLKHKAHTAHRLLTDLLNASDYIKLRDIRSISRSKHRLTSTLSPKYYRPDSYDYDIPFNGNQIALMTNQEDDSENETQDEQNEMEVKKRKVVTKHEDSDVETENEQKEIEVRKQKVITKEDSEMETEDERKELPVMKVEIKSERECEEIFFNETNDLNSDCSSLHSEITIKPEVSPKVKNKARSKAKVFRKKDVNEEQKTTKEGLKEARAKKLWPKRQEIVLNESMFTITKITFKEQIEEIEKRKESIDYTTAPHKCTVCYRSFQNKGRHKNHMLRHSDLFGTFECFVCKMRLKSKRTLNEHVTAQHTVKISCQECPFITKSRCTARNHQQYHEGTKYKCPHCPSEFDQVSTYMNHLRVRHVCDFVCEQCGYTFVSKKGVEVHKRSKHRTVWDGKEDVSLEGPYCETCDVKFLSDEAYTRHLKVSGRHTSDSDPNRIRNDTAYQENDSSNVEVTGTKGEREQEKKGPAVCEECGQKFINQRAIMLHMVKVHPEKCTLRKLHAAKKKCMCEQCGKFFPSTSILRYHMWAHSGGKHFKCHLCDKSFSVKSNLQTHVWNVHNKEKLCFECEQCGRNYSSRFTLTRHMLVHADDAADIGPFKCEYCDKGFICNSDRNTHTKHAHLNEPWPKRKNKRRHK